MEDLISNYLFQYKKCPLPSVGSLQVIDGNVASLQGQNKMLSPVPVILFDYFETPAEGFIRFIADQKHISFDEASDRLSHYCNGLTGMHPLSEVILPSTGKFYLNADGKLVFKQDELPEAFLPAITTERVIHPHVVHTMMVGDKETTSTIMTEYYSDNEKAKREWWWIWAVALALTGASALFVYFNGQNRSVSFGNGQKIIPAAATKTYSTAD